MSSLGDYFRKNGKVILSAAALMAVGIALGIFFAFRAVDGEFERVPLIDVERGTAKVFFISLAALVGGYALILIAGVNNKTVVIICVPFILMGYFCGKFACALVARYEMAGITNLLLAYLPFFICTFILMTVAACTVLSATCTQACDKSSLKPSFTAALKILCINATVSFVFFVVLGSVAGGVIIVTLF